jgi:hypothetical protein
MDVLVLTFDGKTFCLNFEIQHVETLVNPYTAIHKLFLENITNNLIINGEIHYFSLVNLVSRCKKMYL